jgi:hypothetical protein
MENVTKIQIAYTLLIGVLLAVFNFFGNFLYQKRKSNPQFSKLFLAVFIIGVILVFLISMIILFNPSIDLHIFGDIFRITS